MDIVETLVRQHNCLVLSRPFCRRGPGGVLLPMYDTQLSSRFEIKTVDSQTGRSCLCEGGGPVKINDCSLNAVIWREGCISIYSLPPCSDVISFDFSGCVMALFCLDGTWFSAHIHMGGAWDCTLEWINFVQRVWSRITAYGMFRPNVALLDEACSQCNPCMSSQNAVQAYLSIPKLWGIITTTGQFVSLCVRPLDNSFQRVEVLSVEELRLGFDISHYASLLKPFLSRAEAKSQWERFWKSHTGQLRFDAFRQPKSKCSLI